MGPDGNAGKHSWLCAPEILQNLTGTRPRERFAQSLVTPGKAQRSGFAGKRRSKGTNAVFAARRKRSGVDFATTSRHGQSNSPPGSGAIRKETYLWRRNRETPQRRAESSRPTEGAKTKMGAAGASPRPTGFKKTFWDWVGEAPLGLPPGFAPVPLARQTQARKRNRTGGKFPPTQGPSGPRWNRRQALLVLRAGGVQIRLRRGPRKWGPGKGDYEHEVLIGAGPYPLCPFGTSPLDKGSQPRRRFGSSPRASRRSPAKRVRREEEEQGSGRSFRC